MMKNAGDLPSRDISQIGNVLNVKKDNHFWEGKSKYDLIVSSSQRSDALYLVTLMTLKFVRDIWKFRISRFEILSVYCLK